MGALKKLGTYVTLAIAVLTAVISTDGAVPATWVPKITILIAALGALGSLLAKQVIGKSDDVRLADSLPLKPADRATDKPVQP